MFTIDNLILVACWVAFLVVWLVSSFSTKRTLSRGNSFGLFGIVLRVGVLAVVYFIVKENPAWLSAYNNPGATHPLLGVAGVACALLGIGFAIWSRMYLGSNWGMPMSVKEQPELVTSGPYRYLRHPIYVGVLLAILGSALVSGVWWVGVFAAAAIYFAVSAHKEETLMLHTFPDTYPAYQKRTYRFIPFVF